MIGHLKKLIKLKINILNRTSMTLIFGLAFGAILGFFLFKKIKFSNAIDQFNHLNYQYIELAIICYCLSLLLRSYRWLTLLRPGDEVGFFSIFIAVVNGYTINLLLPARMGEYYRINFCNRYFSFSRLRVLGSLILERATDGLMIVGILTYGILELSFNKYHYQLFKTMAFTSLGIFGGVVICMYLLSSKHVKKNMPHYQRLNIYYEKFHESLEILRTSLFIKSLLLVFIIWAVELLTIKFILESISIKLTLAQLSIVIGVISLSTMLPSAPAFLGTMQYAYFLTLNLWGYSLEQAIAAAAVHQFFIFGPTITMSLIFYMMILTSKKFRKFLCRQISIGDTICTNLN
jgi:uncharacterized protein (TIRG00374 family)